MIIAFFLDGIIAKYFTIYPVLTLLSLIFLKENKYLLVIIFGLLYDITYTDTLFLNTIIFYLLLFFIDYYFSKINKNFVNTIILGIILILIYRFSTYIILYLLNMVSLDITSFIKILGLSFISLIYIIIRYFYKYLL